MAKPTGHPSDLPPVFVINSFSDHHHSFMDHHHHTTTTTTRFPPPSPPPPTIQFSINDDHDQDPDDRPAVNEVDFFSSENKTHISDSPAGDPTRLELNVNTGLNLLTTNTSSDQSTVDDVTSPATAEKAKSELAILQVELEKMNTENQRLKNMICQVNNNYSSLQMHFLAVMQQKRDRNPEKMEDSDQILVSDAKTEDPKQSIAVPRQFLDLGDATAAVPEMENSLSSSEGNNNNNSNNGEAAEMETRLLRREESSPEQQGFSKVPRFSPSKTVDQTEATMRKARVSVRARSESPIVIEMF